MRAVSRICLTIALSVLALSSAKAQFAPQPPYGGDFWTAPKLTGDWGGVRDDWAKHGVTLDFDTVYTVQGVAGGGIPGAPDSLGNTLLGEVMFQLDTGKAGLWPGGFLKIGLQGRWGTSDIAKAGTLSAVDTTALFPNSVGNTGQSVVGITDFNFTQFLSPQFGLIAGLIDTVDGDDNPIAGNIRRNSTFLNTAFLASLVETTAGPNVTPGAGVIFIPTPNIVGQLLAIGSEETATRNPFNNYNGTTITTAWTVKHEIFGQPGSQVFGVLYSIGKKRTDIFTDPRVFIASLIVLNSVPTTTKDSWALYYNGAQYIQGDEKHGWGPFLRAGISDGDPNPVKANVSVGLGGKGTFPGRDDDSWGAGFYYLDISHRGLLAAANVGDEMGGEAYYNVGITPALHTTLDAQLVSSARPRQQTATVLALRVKLDF